MCGGGAGRFVRGWGAGAGHRLTNDFDGWAAATGAFSTIDFQTLPDGSPTFAGAHIIESFNYTDQVATFSDPFDALFFGGNPTNGFDLVSFPFPPVPGQITQLRADLVTPADSVGFFFPGHTNMKVFGTDGDFLLATGRIFSPGISDGFLGVVSDIPIGYITMDEGGVSNSLSFHFSSVPEPATAGLLLVGGLAVLRRRRERI